MEHNITLEPAPKWKAVAPDAHRPTCSCGWKGISGGTAALAMTIGMYHLAEVKSCVIVPTTNTVH